MSLHFRLSPSDQSTSPVGQTISIPSQTTSSINKTLHGHQFDRNVLKIFTKGDLKRMKSAAFNCLAMLSKLFSKDRSEYYTYRAVYERQRADAIEGSGSLEKSEYRDSFYAVAMNIVKNKVMKTLKKFKHAKMKCLLKAKKQSLLF